ncbi:hypothetical protein CDD82_1202 [Ophiocordyceps australis]|uniref:L-ornithine N(5)-monooxygenase [NAD(P)H] n=1 Tax=Ophiocordyceps australis TaxID=1399860 RepID=A0A2C5YDV8_9HYPO|nr:hypothetical protein CDD82_1202 [Ophiocordyceps australis]
MGSSEDKIVVDVIVVGAGFGGCYALHHLRAQGYSTKVLEAGSGLGGVWHFNRYPGCRVDSEAPVYQLSLPQAWATFDFKDRYPAREELENYFGHLDKTLQLGKDVIFNARVARAEYDAGKNTWEFCTQDGLKATGRYAVFACGTTHKAYIPEFKKLDEYKGLVIHPSRWPQDVNVKGKKIGIIGQGASALQIIQDVAKQECELTVFIRTPCNAFPMGARSIQESKDEYQEAFDKAKKQSEQGYAIDAFPVSYHGATAQQRRHHYEQLWARGGYGVFMSNYYDILLDKEANGDFYAFWAAKVRARMSDPVKRDIVAPLKQSQWIGTKRATLECDYYEMLDRANVKLVNLKKTPMTQFCSAGIMVDDAAQPVHELDIVILATGYDAVTGSLYDTHIHGRDGVSLQEKWQGGISTFLGLMAPGFPNAFLLYGPQAPTSLVNAPPLLELQVEWVARVLEEMKRRGMACIDVRERAAAEWSQKTWAAFNATLSRETGSWWTGENIPGKKREPLIWFGGMRGWWRECERALENWGDFVVDG